MDSLATENPNLAVIANRAIHASKSLDQWTRIRRLLNIAEENRNAWLHSTWWPNQGQLKVKILQEATATEPEGSCEMLLEGDFGLGTDSNGVAVRSKTTAKQGKGLSAKTATLSLQEMKTANVKLCEALIVTIMFSHYHEGDDHDAHVLSDQIDNWLNNPT